MKVYTTIPDEWEEYLEDIRRREGYRKISQFLFDLIRSELKKRGYIGGDNNE